MAFTRLSLFGPAPGQFPFLVSQTVAPTISSILSLGGYAGIVGHVPATTTFNGVIDTAVVGAANVPVPVASVLKGGTVSLLYTETISSQGGVSPVSYALLSGALPTGLTLNSSTGAISGTPTTPGTYSFTIKAQDSLGNVGSQAFSITISLASGGGAFTFIA